MSSHDETKPACPKCFWHELVEDRTVPGMVYTLCGRCGAHLAMRAERRIVA